MVQSGMPVAACSAPKTISQFGKKVPDKILNCCTTCQYISEWLRLRHCQQCQRNSSYSKDLGTISIDRASVKNIMYGCQQVLINADKDLRAILEFVCKRIEVHSHVDIAKALVIDPGLNNWLTCVNNVGSALILDGLHLKSVFGLFKNPRLFRAGSVKKSGILKFAGCFTQLA